MKFLQFFSLVDTQAKMALKAEATRLYLSYLWWVLEPLLYVLVFYAVFEILLNSGKDNFLLFLMLGKIPFLWFSKSVMNASTSIVENRGIIGQLSVPKTLFPYISIQESLYKQSAVFVVLIVFVLVNGVTPAFNWLWLIPLVVVQYALIVFCSLIGAYLVSFVGDFRTLISMGMMFLMFSSGIFWNINDIARHDLRDGLMTYNPVAFLIDAYRKILMHQEVYDLTHMFFLSVLLLVGIMLMHYMYTKSSKLIAIKVIS